MKIATNHCVLLLADDAAVAARFRQIAGQMIAWVESPAAVASAAFRPWEVEETYELSVAVERVREALHRQRPYSLVVVCPTSDDEQTLIEMCTQLLVADRFLPLLLCSEAAHRHCEKISTLLAAPERLLILGPPAEESLVRHWLAAQADRREARAQLQECRHEAILARGAAARAEERVAEANRAKTEFLSNISHEIRTPMNAILGFSRLLRQGSLSAEQAEKLGFIHDAAASLMGIFENMLDLALLSEGNFRASRDVFRLETVLQEVVEAVRPAVRSKGLSLHCHLQEAIPRWLQGDRKRLGQILHNLVSNALKFTEHGSIHIRATLDEEETRSVAIRLVVSDTGVGIPVDRQMVIFDSFAQADGSVTRRFGGVGVGLSICKRLLDLLGGQIGFRSVEGEGSSFWFTLPLERGCPDAAQEAEGEPDRAALAIESDASETLAGQVHGESRASRVLVIEEEYLPRAILEMLLARSGCFVDLVDNHREALSVWEGNYYDLVLLDVAGGEVGLSEVVAKIRESADAPRSTRLIAMGPSEGPLGRQACLEAGADDFVAKPFTMDVLLEALGPLLTRPQDASPEPDGGFVELPEPAREPYASLPQWIVRLHEALRAQNYQVLEHCAETLRNMAARHGSQKVADHAMRLQLAARNRDSQRAALALERLIGTCHDGPAVSSPVPVPLVG